jgi:hypothetical protein
MAISPNTDFTAGQVLTSDQANRFPRGIMAQATGSANFVLAGGVENISITASTFTAVANRYYRITYFEPSLPLVQNANTVTMRVRLTNVTGTVIGSTVSTNADTNAGTFEPTQLTCISTFSAGSVVLVGTLTSPGAVVTAARSATSQALILVEDIGPA